MADAFVTKYRSSGGRGLLQLPWRYHDTLHALGIAVDGAGNAYLTGRTPSNNLPTTPGAYQVASAGGWDAFVTKFNPTGSGLVYSTYLGVTILMSDTASPLMAPAMPTSRDTLVDQLPDDLGGLPVWLGQGEDTRKSS